MPNDSIVLPIAGVPGTQTCYLLLLGAQPFKMVHGWCFFERYFCLMAGSPNFGVTAGETTPAAGEWCHASHNALVCLDSHPYNLNDELPQDR